MVTFVSPLWNLTLRITSYPVDSGLPVSLSVRVPTFATNSLLKYSARTAVPCGLLAERLLVFLSQRGGVSHCSLAVSPRWPARVTVTGCAGKCGLPRHPRTSLICNYLLQCSGRLRFVPVQDADYRVCTCMHAGTRCYRADGFPQSSTPSTQAASFQFRFSRCGSVELLIKAPCVTCIPGHADFN